MFADEFCLLGDPALDITLVPAPSQATSYRSGLEIEDAAVLQDVVVARTGAITLDNARVVNQAATLAPLRGERMLKVGAHVGAGGAGSIEWKIQDLSVPITQNMILSFWLNVVSTPSSNGKIALDGNSSAGRIKDRPDIFDQNGVVLDAKARTPAGAGWKLYYADLSPLKGATLQDIRVRYESESTADSGSILVYADDIRVERYESIASQELVNHSFEEDVDDDGTPDFWTDLDGDPVTANALRSDLAAVDGRYSMLVRDLYANGGGARQIFTANRDVLYYTMVLRYFAPQATSCVIRIHDVDAGTSLSQSVDASGTWQTLYWTFGNAYWPVRPGRYSLEVLPQDPSLPVYVDNIELKPPVVVGAGDDDGVIGARGRARLLGVWPNPVRIGSEIRLSFVLAKESEVEFEFFDGTGRLAVGVPKQHFGKGNHAWMGSLGGRGGELRAGVWFVRMRVDGKWLGEAVKMAVLQ